jgi:hypothetical protein
VRRPDYVPRDATYVRPATYRSRNAEGRPVQPHRAVIGRMWVRVLIVILGLLATGVACVALWRIGQLRDQERAGWPVVTPAPISAPAACHGLRGGCHAQG